MKRLVSGFLVSLVLSCTNNSADAVRYSGQEQLLTLNELNRNGSRRQAPVIKSIYPDSVSRGNEFLARIFIADTSLKIVNAFFACQTVQMPTVDTATLQVKGCSKQLLVKNDTIFIGFRVTETGLKQFPAITLLTVDHENIFRTDRYQFQYNVTQ